MPASLAIAARPLALASAAFVCAAARADNTATVRLSLLNTDLIASNTANQFLWNRRLADCSAIGTISSVYAGSPGNYKWFYDFSNVSPFSGSLGEFGSISLSTDSIFGTSRYAPGVVGTNIQITTRISLLGNTYFAQNNAALTFSNGSPDDLSLTGGDLMLQNLRQPFYANGAAEPFRLLFTGVPVLRVEIIPAPAGTLALSSGLLALHRRRR